VLTAFLAVAAALAGTTTDPQVAALGPREKAALLVVTTQQPRVFFGAAGISFADQEGGLVKAFPGLPPGRGPADYRDSRTAFAAGRATAAALRRKGVQVDFAPVLDTADGPLGSRQFRRPELGVAFAHGLGRAACVKHFPGLGSAAYSTDVRPHVDARVRPRDLAPFRAAIRAGVRCVMVGHAFYPSLGTYRASLEPKTYRLLRSLGFRGVAITDSLSIIRRAPIERWSPQAVRAGADLLLVTSPAHAARAIRALEPLARRGELDVHVERVLRYRQLVRR
jgi:beta-N-acetylhexosaminidase